MGAVRKVYEFVKIVTSFKVMLVALIKIYK